MARSETPSEYSRRAWDSRGSLDNDDMIQSRPESYAPSSQTHHQIGEHMFDSALTEDSQESEMALEPRISMLGPKTRHVTPAPWEPGGEDDIVEQEEEDNQEMETRSLFGGRARHKKAKDPSSKPRIFPASFAPRASSSSRPSVDVSTPTSSSSGGRMLPTGRRGSTATSQSIASDLPFPSHRYDRPAVASPVRTPREIMDNDIPPSPAPSHPYANPKYAASQSVYDDQASINVPPSPASVYPPSIMFSPKSPSNGHGSHIPSSVPTPPPLPAQNAMPQKMAPWQYAPGSPTFQLVSLEEAQALKARQRQMSLGATTTEQPAPRSRTISGPNRKSMLPLERPPADFNTDNAAAPAGKTLKGRRSLMGLFAKAKEKEKSGVRTESPPPVPVLPNRSATTPGTPLSSSSHVETPTIPTPVRHESTPQPKSVTPKRLPPPSLNVVVTSPQPRIDHPYRDDFHPPPAIPMVQKSATPPPSFPSSGRTQVPRKQVSAQTLSPTSSYNKPNSAPSTIQGFSGLSIRPVSTIFNSMPTDYLAQTPSAHPMPSIASGSNSGHSMTQSPTTPSLWSSRSESVSTGSLDIQQPLTPGGFVQSMSSSSSLEGPGGATSLSLLQKQVYGARDVWKSQISDLEAQVKALKVEIAGLRNAPCPACGHLGGGSSCMDKQSIINRPRAKTATSNKRFGDGE